MGVVACTRELSPQEQGPRAPSRGAQARWVAGSQERLPSTASSQTPLAGCVLLVNSKREQNGFWGPLLQLRSSFRDREFTDSSRPKQRVGALGLAHCSPPRAVRCSVVNCSSSPQSLAVPTRDPGLSGALVSHLPQSQPGDSLVRIMWARGPQTCDHWG